MFLNRNDRDSCTMCKTCYRNNSLECEDACRRCGIGMFSEDTFNVYPNAPLSPTPIFNGNTALAPNRIYFNYPRVSSFIQPALLPFANYYGAYNLPMLNYY